MLCGEPAGISGYCGVILETHPFFTHVNLGKLLKSRACLSRYGTVSVRHNAKEFVGASSLSMLRLQKPGLQLHWRKLARGPASHFSKAGALGVCQRGV